MLPRPIFANHADKLHFGKEAGGVGEMRSGAPQQAVTAGLGRFNVINGNGADDEQGHNDLGTWS
jgi:hypothetical protein